MGQKARICGKDHLPFLLNYYALSCSIYPKKAMYQPLQKAMYQPFPCITEDLESLQARLRSERDAQLRPRLHLLVLLKSGQVTTRRQAAAPLAVHRNTVALW
jgi:hypothetical protein